MVVKLCDLSIPLIKGQVWNTVSEENFTIRVYYCHTFYFLVIHRYFDEVVLLKFELKPKSYT